MTRVEKKLKKDFLCIYSYCLLLFNVIHYDKIIFYNALEAY